MSTATQLSSVSTSQSSTNAAKLSWVTWILLGGLVLLAVFTRVYDLGAESFWRDEVTMVNLTTGDYDVFLQDIMGGRPPVYTAVSVVWAQLFGTGEAAVRSLSALSSLLAVAVMYLVARDLFNERVAFISTLLMIVSGYHIHYAQDHRYYAMLMFVALASFYFLIRFVRYGKTVDMVGYIIASILVFYTHTNGMFVIFGQGVFYLLQIRKYRPVLWRWLISEVIIALAILPGVLLIVGGLSGAATDDATGTFGPTSWIDMPTLMSPVQSVVRFFFFTPDYFNIAVLAVAAAFAIGAIIAIATQNTPKMLSQRAKQAGADIRNLLGDKFSEILLTLIWFVTPIALPFILSYIVAPMYLDRYVIVSSGAAYILVALVLTSIRKILPEYVLLGALLIVMGVGLYNYYVLPTKEQWREAIDYVSAQYEENTAIVAASRDGTQETVEWYYSGSPELTICPPVHVEIAEDGSASGLPTEYAAFDDCTAGLDRIWATMVYIDVTPEYEAQILSIYTDREENRWEVVDRQYLNRVAVYTLEPVDPS